VGLVIVYACASATGELKPGEDLIEPIALLFAPLAINVCYTAGWVVELLVRPARPLHPLAPRLLWLGLVFSLTVVALPAVIWLGIWFFAILAR